MPSREEDAIEQLASALSMPDPEPSEEYLHHFLQAFSRIVYENVSKIIRFAEIPNPKEAIRLPELLIADYFEFGTGGTCFSLTYLAYRMLRQFGLDVSIVMGDRSYGEDTHTALVCDLTGRAFLLDVGFLIFQPVPLDPRQPCRVITPINNFEIVPAARNLFDAYTHFRGKRKHRFTIKLDRLDGDAFLPFWWRTFDFGMMAYPLVTKLEAGTQYYLQNNVFQIRTADATIKKEYDPEELPELVQGNFGIDPQITRRALELCEERKT